MYDEAVAAKFNGRIRVLSFVVIREEHVRITRPYSTLSIITPVVSGGFRLRCSNW